VSVPLISVLLPVYNAERYVTEAVESILRQTFGDFELIALDDGSTDGSLANLRRCAESDARMRLISRPNTGLVDALNELLSNARGEFVARMDADDVARPERFALQLSHLRSHPACVALGTQALFIDPDGCPIFEFMQHFSHEEVERALLRPEIGILHPTVMMRRAAVERVGGYRHGYRHVEDLDLFLRLAEIGTLANLRKVLLDYRVHTGSVSHSHTVEQSESGLKAVTHALQRRGAGPTDVLQPPVSRPETVSELHRKWAWWALGARNLGTARKHALRAFVKGPAHLENWRVLACSVRGH
jgi:glycosyltransferase involved in cell wall biosynthesis